MYSRQGVMRLPQSSRGHEAPTSRRGVRMFGLMFGLCALALMNTDFVSSRHRALSEVRKLCNTVFNYPDWDQYWEDLFGAPKTYDGAGDRSLLPSEPNNIGYFLTLTSCPNDGYPGADPHDPGHAFYDAAALLKYSIYRNTYPAGSKYNATMYAIVHPSAVRCKGPNGDEYDRVKVLQDLGYHITILGSPAYQKNLQGYVQEHIAEDAGERDFMRLRALTFDNHPAVVLVDFTTLMMQPIDNIYDSFINDPSQKVRYTGDYPTNLPNTGSNSGPNMHWVMLKPDPVFFDTLVNSYLSTDYSPILGWNNQGVKDFDGILGVKGFLAHYFSRVETGKNDILQRCVYGNANIDPYAIDPSGNAVCRDPDDCQDCRIVDFDSIKVIKMIHTCGKPWECSYDDTWDEGTMLMCESFHRSWFSARIDFEESCWHDGPPSYRTGTFHPYSFMGFCSCEGLTCYDRMIDDKAAPMVCDKDTQTNDAIGRLTLDNGYFQDQHLGLTTGNLTGSPTACVSGFITLVGFEPPYNLGIVIDVSGSTAVRFGGNPTGDVNGDGRINTILDAEIASVVAMIEQISAASDLGNHNVNIGLTSFSTHATYHGQFPPSNPDDPSKIHPDILNTLMSLRSGGYTHFDDALDKTILFFEEAPKDRSNLLIFLSDGIPNVPGDGDNEDTNSIIWNNNPAALMYDSEIAALDAMNVKRMAIGVGSGSDVREGYGLDKIDNTPDPVTGKGPVLVASTDALNGVLLSNPVLGNVTAFSISVNGVQQGGIDPSHVAIGPTGFTFGSFVITGLDPLHGSVNEVSASVTIDYDGMEATIGDQVILTVKNLIPGTLG